MPAKINGFTHKIPQMDKRKIIIPHTAELIAAHEKYSTLRGTHIVQIDKTHGVYVENTEYIAKYTLNVVVG